MTVTCYFHVPLLVDIPDALNNTFNQALTEGRPWRGVRLTKCGE